MTGELQTGGIVVERGALLKGCILIGNDGGESAMHPQVDAVRAVADAHSVPPRVASESSAD